MREMTVFLEATPEELKTAAAILIQEAKRLNAMPKQERNEFFDQASERCILFTLPFQDDGINVVLKWKLKFERGKIKLKSSA